MTAKDLDLIKSFYYGMISLNDKYIGRMLDSLSGQVWLTAPSSS
jgi:hypothetical protein